uniref:Ig-like domain-containing protein n=1 Tax=Macaca nemestrina TaxID=9545 RepID=A0A2K6B1D7_MACNE|nr:selection and upkeep of intraepithelial T-cells protein 1-like isoform X4 [Macaca nemestrina]XP_011762409.1 selection and upkeep of intraepithelial T-cells protein 1-like isoform X4 [Macaca nemestrina]XP_011762410.1 selection and upkeep of intraepithelial T-cells protein 1-like isoform X4 [Macaca nemestrina]
MESVTVDTMSWCPLMVNEMPEDRRVMEPAFSSLSGYFVAILLLQITVLTSEQFTVSSSRSHHVVMVGSQAELSCQLSPPQNAQLMQVGWFRDRHSQMIYLYEDGEEHSGEGIQNYMNRTVFLKDALEEGKITLQIYNVTVFHGGQYHCFFKDGHTYEEGIVDLRVAAVGLDVQINVQILGTEGFVVECTSGGWFPQAQMAWRDSSGNVIPHSSKSYSQDGAGLLHLKMTILLKNSTHGPVTCCFYNPVTGREKRAGIVISDILFKSEYMSLMSHKISYPWIYLSIVVALLFLRIKVAENIRCVHLVFQCLPFLMYIGILPIYLQFRKRVSVSDDLFLLYSIWTDDLCIILGILMLFFTLLIFVLLYTLKDFVQLWTSGFSSETEEA